MLRVLEEIQEAVKEIEEFQKTGFGILGEK